MKASREAWESNNDAKVSAEKSAKSVENKVKKGGKGFGRIPA
jgi:hypothetical protein